MMEPNFGGEPKVGTPLPTTTIANEVDRLPSSHLALHRERLVRMAASRLRRLGIVEADVDAEGVVNEAFLKLCQKDATQGGGSVSRSDEFLRFMSILIARLVNDQRKRARASRRGGKRPRSVAGSGRGRDADVGAGSEPITICRRPIELDHLVSPEPPIVDVVAAKLDIEAFLGRLPDDFHRKIFALRAERHSIESIASSLGVARRTVERKLKENEAIYRKWVADS